MSTLASVFNKLGDAADVIISMHIVSDGAATSLASVCDVLAASELARQAFSDLFPNMVDAELSSSVSDLLFDRSDLLFGETVIRTADGALEIVLQPAQWYLELVAAIAANGDVACDFDLHGWPFLTLGVGTSSVTEPLGASSLGRGRSKG